MVTPRSGKSDNSEFLILSVYAHDDECAVHASIYLQDMCVVHAVGKVLVEAGRNQ